MGRDVGMLSLMPSVRGSFRRRLRDGQRRRTPARLSLARRTLRAPEARRGRARRRAVSLALLGTLLAFPLQSAASEPEEFIAVDYTAAPGCESRDDFLRDITRRTVKARPEDSREAARRFEVIIVVADGVYAGRLVVHGLDGTRLFRSLSAETCAQATRALALMVALSIDPHARTRPAPSAPDVGDPSRSVGAAAPLPPQPEPRPPNEGASSSRATPEPVPPRGGHRPWMLSAGPDAEELLLAEPHPVLALGVHVELAHQRGVSLRASFRRTPTTTVSSESVGGRFTWTWARVDGCPLRIGGQVEVRPCVMGELGEVDGVGFGGTTATQRGRPWATVGLLVRPAIHVGPLTLSADVGVGVTLNRESFVFVPSPTVYQMPAWIAFSGLALAGDWWL